MPVVAGVTDYEVSLEFIVLTASDAPQFVRASTSLTVWGKGNDGSKVKFNRCHVSEWSMFIVGGRGGGVKYSVTLVTSDMEVMR
jgi:hypothetical protein